MTIRGLVAGLFLVLGSLMTIPGSIAIWQERTILNEDNFVKTTTDVLDQPDVQTLVASRMTDAIMTQLDVENRIDSALVNLQESRASDNGLDLTILERPIVSSARNVIYQVCVRIVQSDLGSNARDTVLRTVHRAFLAVVQNNNESLKTTNGQVVLDLRPLVVDAIDNLASERVASAADAKLSPDAGQIVLVEGRGQSGVWTLLGWLDDFDPVVPLVAIALLIVALVVSADRTRMLGFIGAAIVLTSGLAVFLASTPLKDLATNWPPRQEGRDAAASAYDVLLNSFRRQELYFAMAGMGLVSTSAIARHPQFFRSIRAHFSGAGDASEGVGLRSWITARSTAIRAAGLAVAAVTLELWPDPTTRVIITVLGALSSFIAIMWLVTSETEFAASTRKRVGRVIGPGRSQSQDARVPAIARWAGILRVAGIVVAAAVLLLAQKVTPGLLVLVFASVLLYLAIVDYLSSRRESGEE